MLRIYLLGSFRLFYKDEPLKFSALPKTLPLWAYLLLNPAPVARDQLASALWPDIDSNEARAKLRRHLHDLRRALPRRGRANRGSWLTTAPFNGIRLPRPGLTWPPLNTMSQTPPGWLQP